MDGNSERWGQLSAYYFFDDYFVNNPYPTGQGGASVPGFSALNLGRAQIINLSDVRAFGASSVNEFHFSYMRNANNVGQPLCSEAIARSVRSAGYFSWSEAR